MCGYYSTIYRIIVRDRLQQLEIVQEDENVYPICRDGRQESWHFFVHCARVYKVWARVTMLWEMTFVGLGNVVSTFDLWSHAYPNGSKVFLWCLAFIALVWIIWRLRNRTIF